MSARMSRHFRLKRSVKTKRITLSRVSAGIKTCRIKDAFSCLPQERLEIRRGCKAGRKVWFREEFRNSDGRDKMWKRWWMTWERHWSETGDVRQTFEMSKHWREMSAIEARKYSFVARNSKLPAYRISYPFSLITKASPLSQHYIHDMYTNLYIRHLGLCMSMTQTPKIQ